MEKKTLFAHFLSHTYTHTNSFLGHLEWFDLVQSQERIRTEDDRILIVACFGRGWKLQLHLGTITTTPHKIKYPFDKRPGECVTFFFFFLKQQNESAVTDGAQSDTV